MVTFFFYFCFIQSSVQFDHKPTQNFHRVFSSNDSVFGAATVFSNGHTPGLERKCLGHAQLRLYIFTVSPPSGYTPCASRIPYATGGDAKRLISFFLNG